MVEEEMKQPEHNKVDSQPQAVAPMSRWQRTVAWFGFQKGYNLPLFIIFAGAMVGFTLARLQYLDIGGKFANGASPGDWYWYQGGHYRVGITLHLGCILPTGLLMVWQFIPAIRHRAILFHRMNGYIIIALVIVSNTGALMIVRRSFGGEIATQAAVGILVIISSIGLALAYYNIKKLQIDQHRAWMLRTMFYLGTIITTRLIMIIAAQITSAIGSYYVIMTCGELGYVYRDNPGYVQQFYPQCTSTGTNNTYAIVHADFVSGQPDQIGASLRLNFGTAIWLALFLHAVGVELYLSLTPRESQRLREVSYQRQLEAGSKKPGSAGLVVENWGDAEEWKPSNPS